MRFAAFEDSLWAATAAPAPHTPALDEPVRADVAVVGAGYTGLSTALHLAQRGVDVVVVEAEEPGFGASGRNGGHCTPTFMFHEVDKVRAMLGPKWGERFVRLQADAAELVFGLIRTNGIDCEAAQNGYLQAAHTPSKMAALEKRCADFAALGKACRMLDRAEVANLTGTDKYFGGWLHPEGGHLNPLGYARGLARAALDEGVRIFSRSPVLAIKREDMRWRVETARGAVAADRVVIGTGAYSTDIWPALRQSFSIISFYFVASQPLSENVRNSVLPGNNHMADTRRDAHFLKYNGQGRLIAGGRGEWRRGSDPAFSRRVMTERMHWLFPQIGDLDWQFFWNGMVDFVPKTLPKLYELAPGVSAALGYSGRGVPTATAMGTVLAEHAYGTPPDELAVQVSDLKRLRGRSVIGLVPALLAPFDRLADNRALRRDGIEVPAL